MREAVLTMSETTHNTSPVIAGLNGRELFHSFGRAIPDFQDYDTVTFWGAGLYAAKLQNINFFRNLSSPGPEWLTTISQDLTGRKLYSGTVDDLPDDGAYFIKPAEAKINSLPAQIYELGEVSAVFNRQNFDRSIHLQWTPNLLTIDREHRFFVADGNIVTGSPYNVEGLVGYNPHISFTYMENARKFAEEVLQELKGFHPQAFTLDVGMNMATGSWFVVEANRAWSSGFYHSQPELALDVAEYSCSEKDNEWLWLPDKHITDLLLDHPSLKIEYKNNESLEYVQYIKSL